MKFIYVLLFCCFSSCTTTKEEKTAIKTTFDTYKDALLTDKYALSAECIDRKTIAYYESIRQHALRSDSTTVASLPFIEELLVLIVRAKASKEKLESLKDETFFAYLSELELIDKKGVMGMDVVNIQLHKDFATAELTSLKLRRLLEEDSSAREMIPYFEFYKESGEWKLNLTAPLKKFEVYANESLMKTGRNKQAVIIKSVEEETGQAPKFEKI